MRHDTPTSKSTKRMMREYANFISLRHGRQSITSLVENGLIAITVNILKLVSWFLLTVGILAVIMPLVILAYFIRILFTATRINFRWLPQLALTGSLSWRPQ